MNITCVTLISDIEARCDMSAVIERDRLTERDKEQLKACRELVQQGSVIAAILDGIIDDDVVMLRKDEELSPAQAAGILGVSRPYVTRLLKSGLLESHMVGSHHRISVAALQDYMVRRDAGRKEYARALNSRRKNTAATIDAVAPVSQESRSRMHALVAERRKRAENIGNAKSSQGVSSQS